jgi:hypothetical protein
MVHRFLCCEASVRTCCRAVCHDILHFSVRVLVTVVALPSATPYPGGLQQRLGRERLSSRGSSGRFLVALPAASADWLWTFQLLESAEFSSGLRPAARRQRSHASDSRPLVPGVPVAGRPRVPLGCDLRSGSTSHPAFAHGTRSAVVGYCAPRRRTGPVSPPRGRCRGCSGTAIGAWIMHLDALSALSELRTMSGGQCHEAPGQAEDFSR